MWSDIYMEIPFPMWNMRLGKTHSIQRNLKVIEQVLLDLLFKLGEVFSKDLYLLANMS